MKYATVAVALAGVVAADGWNTWTDKKPVDPATTWDPVWDPEHPEPTASTWTEWDPKHPKPTGTWTEWDPEHVDPATSTWEDWETYATPAPTGKCSYVTDIYTTKCRKGHADQCWPIKTHTTIYADECTWSDWKDPAATTTWAEWEVIETPAPSAECSYLKKFVIKKCNPYHHEQCYEKTVTKTVYPTDCKTKTPVAEETTWVNYPVDDAEKSTWVEWDPTSVKAIVTETKTWEEAVVTKVVDPSWSKDGWFGPAWPTAKDGECVKNTVTSYGYPIWKPVPEASTWSTVSIKTPEADTATTWATYKSPDPETKTTWATASVKTPEAAQTWSPVPGKGHAPIAPNGNKWSMTYTPYNSKGKCKTEEIIKIDIANIAKLGFTSVRVYSTDCKTLEYVGKACRENNLKIILGVFISKTGVSGAAQQVKDIIAWAQWDLVELIVIGNEAIYQGFCKVEDLVWFIKDCKTKFAAAGYTGSCTTTEPLAQWESAGKQFCEVVDVVSANLYAYFNTECTAEGAGDFIQAQITILEGICAKDVYVMESGWPSAGKANGAAKPGKEEQKVAIKSIQEKCGAKISFFSYENEQWKQPGQFGVEQYWGCAGVFGDVSYPSEPAPTGWSKW